MKAELELNTGKGSILLDGVNVAKCVQSLVIDASIYGPPTLTLNMLLTQGATFTDDVVVRLSLENEALLQHLGWTPPAPAPAASGPADGAS